MVSLTRKEANRALRVYVDGGILSDSFRQHDIFDP